MIRLPQQCVRRTVLVVAVGVSLLLITSMSGAAVVEDDVGEAGDDGIVTTETESTEIADQAVVEEDVVGESGDESETTVTESTNVTEHESVEMTEATDGDVPDRMTTMLQDESSDVIPSSVMDLPIDLENFGLE